MTISEFLKGSFDFTFSDANILTVLTRRGISADEPFENVSEKSRDLATADLYIILASAASGGGRRVQKGNRSVSERTYQFGVYDRRALGTWLTSSTLSGVKAPPSPRPHCLFI